jgi:hypothetical protein
MYMYIYMYMYIGMRGGVCRSRSCCRQHPPSSLAPVEQLNSHIEFIVLSPSSSYLYETHTRHRASRIHNQRTQNNHTNIHACIFCFSLFSFFFLSVSLNNNVHSHILLFICVCCSLFGEVVQASKFSSLVLGNWWRSDIWMRKIEEKRQIRRTRMMKKIKIKKRKKVRVSSVLLLLLYKTD